MRVFLIGLLLFVPSTMHAAQLLVLPTQSTHAVGDAFTLSVVVSSADQAMNAAQGLLSFPPDLLEVLSIQKTGIVTFWVKEPSFSNSAGTLQFEGIVLNPGYQGARGTLLSLVVRAKRSGTASLTLANAQVLANDGVGTGILSSTRGATVTIEPRAAVEEPSTTPAVVPAPAQSTSVSIASPTHPDPTAWYHSDHALVRFGLPAGADALRTLLDHEARSTPTVVYAPPITEKELRDLDDGIWYVHAGARTDGVWGATTHRALRVDTTPPVALEVKVEPRTDPTDPFVTITLSAQDELSGIARYELEADNGLRTATTSTRVVFGPLSPGDVRITVRAVDGAENERTSDVSVHVEPLDAPVITSYQETLTPDAPIWVRGTSKYPGDTVHVRVSRGKGDSTEYETRANRDGSFYLAVGEPPARDTYQVSAYVVDERGAQSSMSKVVTIRRGGMPVPTTEWFFLLLPLLVALLAIVYSIYRVRRIKRRVRREVHETRNRLVETLRLLRADADDIVSAARASHKGRRAPTKAETEAIAQLTSDLTDIDHLLETKLDDVEKETS